MNIVMDTLGGRQSSELKSIIVLLIRTFLAILNLSTVLLVLLFHLFVVLFLASQFPSYNQSFQSKLEPSMPKFFFSFFRYMFVAMAKTDVWMPPNSISLTSSDRFVCEFIKKITVAKKSTAIITNSRLHHPMHFTVSFDFAKILSNDFSAIRWRTPGKWGFVSHRLSQNGYFKYFHDQHVSSPGPFKSVIFLQFRSYMCVTGSNCIV